MNKIDIFFIILFMIVISMVIGLRVVDSIDRKISNIAIRMPPIAVPKPHIVINLQKDGEDGPYQTCVQDKTEETKKNLNQPLKS